MCCYVLVASYFSIEVNILSSSINTSLISRLYGNCLCLEFLNPVNILLSEDAVISDKFNSKSSPQSLIKSAEKSGATSKDFTTLKLLCLAKFEYDFNCLATELNLL